MSGLAPRQGTWVIAASFIVALVLMILPMPEWTRYFRPEWLTLVLIFWCMTLPARVSVGTGWFIGLLLDVAHGTLLGQHALALTLVAYVVLRLHQRLRLFPIWQQSLIVLLLVALNQLLVLWIKGISGHSPDSWAYWLPSLTSMAIWPWVLVILRDLKRFFRVT